MSDTVSVCSAVRLTNPESVAPAVACYICYSPVVSDPLLHATKLYSNMQKSTKTRNLPAMYWKTEKSWFNWCVILILLSLTECVYRSTMNPAQVLGVGGRYFWRLYTILGLCEAATANGISIRMVTVSKSPVSVILSRFATPSANPETVALAVLREPGARQRDDRGWRGLRLLADERDARLHGL